jgi:hypothetical protein
MIRRSYTAVVERNVEWHGSFASEPYEAGWASEAIFFIRALRGMSNGAKAKVQITPDGMHWCDEGTAVTVPDEGGMSFCKVSHFGTWLRIVGETDSPVTVLVTLSLKE